MSDAEALKAKVGDNAVPSGDSTCNKNGIIQSDTPITDDPQNVSASENANKNTAATSDLSSENATVAEKKGQTESSFEAAMETTPLNEVHSEPVNQGNTLPPKQPECIGAGDTTSVRELLKVDAPIEVEKNVTETTEGNVNAAPITDSASVPTSPKLNGTAPQVLDGKILPSSITAINASELIISELKQALQKAADERDNYKRKLDMTEKKLGALQTSYDELMKGGNGENALKQMVEQLRGKLIQTSLQLDDRMRLVSNQEKQIAALTSQVTSLKEVETLTRSLLQIRNMEVKNLQAEVDDMEARISEERERYNTMMSKMDAAVQLNGDLKKEYETQLGLFRDLREKYEEKVALLTKEKCALESTQEPAQVANETL